MDEHMMHAAGNAVSPGEATDVSTALRQMQTDVNRSPGPPNRTRLRLKPKAPPTGSYDGAWWPHGDDLRTGLPDLLAVLSVRLGAIDRVLYRFADWAKAPAKIVTGDRAVRLDGYRLQPPNTIEVLGFNRNRIVLLVVPPQTDPDRAHAIMMAAGAPEDNSTAGEPSVVGPRETVSRQRARTQFVAAEARWDSEGGALGPRHTSDQDLAEVATAGTNAPGMQTTQKFDEGLIHPLETDLARTNT
jgi:hypothetical protein